MPPASQLCGLGSVAVLLLPGLSPGLNEISAEIERAPGTYQASLRTHDPWLTASAPGVGVTIIPILQMKNQGLCRLK